MGRARRWYGLVGGGHQATARVRSGKSPQAHRLVFERADHIDDGMRRNPSRQAHHQQVKIAAGQFTPGARLVYSLGSSADRRSGGQFHAQSL